MNKQCAPVHTEVDDDMPRRLLDELRCLGAFGQVWTLTVVVFCAARAVVIWPTLIEFDINPWWFLALDVGTAPTYGVGQAMAVKILRDERRNVRDALPWIGMVLASFLAPYLYVLASARHLPSYVVIGLLLWVLVFGALSAYRMAREVRMEPAAT